MDLVSVQHGPPTVVHTRSCRLDLCVAKCKVVRQNAALHLHDSDPYISVQHVLKVCVPYMQSHSVQLCPVDNRHSLVEYTYGLDA